MSLSNEEIKSLRVAIDQQFRYLHTAFDYTTTGARYIGLSYTAAQRAKMWLGQMLKDRGAENPYPLSKDATSPVIEPTADKSTVIFDIEETDDVAKAKKLRAAFTAQAEAMLRHTEPTFAFTQAYTSLVDANMWLGMYLGEVRDSRLGG